MSGGSTDERPIGVLFVRHAHRLFSDALSEAFKGEPSVRLLTRPVTVGEALDFCAVNRPDVILIDATEVSAPSLGGLIRPIRAACRDAPVVLVADELVDDPFFVAAIEAGASGVVDAAGAIAEVLRAIRAAASGRRSVDPQRLVDAMEKAARARDRERKRMDHLKLLSGREREVLRCLTRGLRNSEIASELLISHRTVEKHVHHILEKLEVPSRLAAVTVAAPAIGEIVYEAMRDTA